VDWCYLGSIGAFIGILLVWDRRVAEKIEEFVGTNTIACFFKSVSDNFKWVFIGVYGPNDDNDRKRL